MDGMVTVTKGDRGWLFHCHCCDMWSGVRPTESRVKKEAAKHEEGKLHKMMAEKVARLRGEDGKSN